MIRQEKFAVAALALGFAAPASAQDVPLSQLLQQFFSPNNPIVLTGGFHQGHFTTQPEAQATLGLLNTNIASQLTSFPLGSSSGGFTYTLDPTLGVLSRNAVSFGPLFAERAITSGKKKFTVGVSYQQNIFEKLEGFDLRGGDIHLTLFHEDLPPVDGTHLNPFFEGDIIDSSLSLRLETNTRVFYANYGVTDRFDVGVVVPWVSVNIDSSITATINDIATTTSPFPIHLYGDGTKTHVFTENGVADGLGDVVVRAKFVAVQQDNFGAAFAADVRLPTGDETELLGAGTTQAKLFAILSGSPKAKFSPHLNLGYTITGTSDVFGSLPDELNYTVGFDAAPTAKFTVFGDVIGRTLIDADRLVSEPRQHQYRTFTDPTVRTFDTTRLVSETGNLTLLLGSAGFKFNIVSRLLLSASALFSLTRDDGLQDDITPVISLDYTF